ncbi:diacylglycerol/lipid kinase family protein [Janibacter anophelis]|uniref:diacylglycerol/lipid kinase family protein n=1 Tax=Janibacter anophelis TaxID=319054 RepID=UPI000DF01EBC|nr:diacylglycerol kinase family protein [Janibacter anophelis]
MRRLLLIANASAGTSDRRSRDAALDVLREEAEVEVVETESIDDLTEAIGGRDGREIVIAGGDGSLNAFATALCRTGTLGEDPPTVGLLPMGTGNDFARSVGLHTDPAQAARIVLSSPLRPVDLLIDDDDRLVANAVHIGVGEEAGRIAAPWKERLGKVRLGVLGYVIGGIAAGLGQHGRHLEVVADDAVVSDGSRRVLQVAITIGTSVGGGTEIAPDARPGDGLAEVVVSYAVAPLRRARYALHLGSGTHTRLDDVVTTRARTVTVRGLHHDVAASADGEELEPARERTWRVVPGAYRLHAPEETA